MYDLLKLAERCEAATGPDERLDRDIFAGIGGSGEPLDPWAGYQLFTASLDAAMTLVPEGWQWMVVSDDCATVFKRRETGGISAPESVVAATPALALCAAALRARAASGTRPAHRGDA